MNQNLLKPLQIGPVTLEDNLLAAPLAGHSDVALRHLLLEYGATFCFCEMVSAEGISRGQINTRRLLQPAANERVYGIQLFAASVTSVERAMSVLAEFQPLIIDLNCGCPVKKIVKNNSGAALMRQPETIAAMVSVMRQVTAAWRRRPAVTIKIRSGWDNHSINYLQVAEKAARAGVDAITLHPRSRADGYSGRADWDKIGCLKRAVDRVVIGSGDLFSAADCRRMLQTSGCDGVMLARGMLNDPLIFSRCRRLFTAAVTDGQEAQAVNADRQIRQIVRICWRHLQLAVDYFGEQAACKKMRKSLSRYLRAAPGVSRLRAEIVKAETLDDYRQLLAPFMRIKMTE